jgi:hypothetical protein
MSNTDILNQIVAGTTRDLFASYEIDLEPTAEGTSEMEYAALIGFAADEARGVVGLAMSGETLVRICELAQAGRSASPEDWLGENVNQLLGRIKSSLMKYGVAVSIALPTVLRGVRLQLMPRAVPGVSTQSFQSSFGSVVSWIDVRWTDERDLTLTTDPEMQATAEGELILF